MPGPAGPKGERVSICICVSILKQIYSTLISDNIYTLNFVSSLQGEKGDAGLPGPIGPQGIPVSLLFHFKCSLLIEQCDMMKDNNTGAADWPKSSVITFLKYEASCFSSNMH